MQLAFDRAICWILLIATLNDDNWKSLAVTVETNEPSFSALLDPALCSLACSGPEGT